MFDVWEKSCICCFGSEIYFKQYMYLVSTQHIQGALVVGDDDVGSLCLQMLPAAHIKPKTQEVLHVTNQDADNPDRGEEKKRLFTE